MGTGGMESPRRGALEFGIPEGGEGDDRWTISGQTGSRLGFAVGARARAESGGGGNESVEGSDTVANLR
jgi:hypothetical protein